MYKTPFIRRYTNFGVLRGGFEKTKENEDDVGRRSTTGPKTGSENRRTGISLSSYGGPLFVDVSGQVERQRREYFIIR